MPRLIPYLQRRGNTLSFRIAVPPDLRPIVGARELVKSLLTQDCRVAEPIALSLAAQAKQLFIKLRGMAKRKTTSTKLLSLNYTIQCDINELGLPTGVKIEAEPHEQEAVNSAIRTIYASAVAHHQKPQSSDTAPGNTTAIHLNDPVPTLKTVIDNFLSKYMKKNKPAMLKKHKPVLMMLLDVVGDKPITKLKQADINEFFDLLENLPPRWADECRKRKLSVRDLAELDHSETLGPKSFDDTYIASVRPFLKSAKKDWQDQGFPLGLTTEGIEYIGNREEGESKQRAFKPHELKRLFEGPEMRAFANDPAQAHRFWLPHVGLYTGARVNEICQLNPQTDIFQDSESGLWCVWITKETDADHRVRKSVKTSDSRTVPIHEKLIELGFIEYVNRVKSTGAKLLFPEWQPINRRASGEAEKWFRQFLRDTNLRDETPKETILGMHAFRHTLLTYGAMQETPYGSGNKTPLSLFCITGHAQDETPIHATGAGKGYLTLSLLSPLKDRAALLNQLVYGLNFYRPKPE